MKATYALLLHNLVSTLNSDTWYVRVCIQCDICGEKKQIIKVCYLSPQYAQKFNFVNFLMEALSNYYTVKSLICSYILAIFQALKCHFP